MTNVLILTNSRDGLNTDAVITKLEARDNTVIRMDIDKVTHGDHQLSIEYSGQEPRITLVTPSHSYDLTRDVESVWLRRPYEYDFAVSSAAERKVAEEEMRDILDGMWAMLASKKWVSDPNALRTARLKPYQLMLAKRHGLVVPKSLITNDPDEARFFTQQGPTIFKPMAGYYFDYGEYATSAFATLLTENHVANLDLVARQPVLLQRYVVKHHELRVTFANDEFFTAKIQTPDYESVVDWRTPENAEEVEYAQAVLPAVTEGKLRSLLRALKLQYAAIDLAVDTEGTHFFLEVNPNGQWMWIEEETGLAISAAIAKSLEKGGE